MAAHQVPPSLGFSRQEHWVAIFFSNAGKWKVKVKLLSRVWLLATPRTTVYRAPPSMGFSRQEFWSGVPLPATKHHPSPQSLRPKKHHIFLPSCCVVTKSCPTVCNTMDCSLPGPFVHENFQARILEWVAISFPRGPSQPRDWPQVSCNAGRFFTTQPLSAGVQPQLIQGIRRRDGIGEGQETTA